MGNVHVASQTATTAQVCTYMVISNVPAADKLQILTSGTYNATLEKRDGKWTITRWYIEADAPLAPSKETISPSAIVSDTPCRTRIGP